MKLSELANLTAGVITSRVLVGNNRPSDSKEEDNQYRGKSIKVLVPKAIHDGKVDHSLLAEEKQNREIPSDFITQEGDIVMKFSSPYDSCIITAEDEGLLIPSFCCKIRLKDFSRTDKVFLLAYLCSNICKQELIKNCYGSVMAMTKKSDVMKIDVPEFDISVQNKLAKRFVTLQNTRAVFEEYLKLEQERFDVIFGGNK